MSTNTNNTEITAPVSVTDVKTVLAVDSNNVGYLCSNKHNKINRWSRCKPVRWPEDFPDRTGDWWKGLDRNCGLEPVTTMRVLDVPGLYTEEFMTVGWKYNPPRGYATYNEPYRLRDFENYMHNAQCPIAGFMCVKKAAPGQNFNASLLKPPTNEPTYSGPQSIRLKDLVIDGLNLEECYFGVGFNSGGSSDFETWATGENPGEWEVNFKVGSPLSVGNTYNVFPFLCTRRRLFDENVPAGITFIPIPCIRIGTDETRLKVITKEEALGISCVILAQYSLGYDAIEATVIIRRSADVSGSFIVASGSIQARFTAINEPTVIGEPYETITGFGLTPGAEYKHTFYLSPILSEKVGKYHIHLTFGNIDTTFEYYVPVLLPQLPDLTD